MKVIAHDRVAVDRYGENLSKQREPVFDPMLAMVEAAMVVAVHSKQPRSAHASGDAMVGSGVIWAYVVAARLGHGASLSRCLVHGCQTLPRRFVG
jgi:hypothetical protein